MTNLRAAKPAGTETASSGQMKEKAVVVNFPRPGASSDAVDAADNEHLLTSIKQRLRQLEHWRVYGVRVEPPSLANALEAYVDASVRLLRTKSLRSRRCCSRIRAARASPTNPLFGAWKDTAMYFKKRARSYWSRLFDGRKTSASPTPDDHAARVNASLDAVVAAINAAAEKNPPGARPGRRL